MPPDLPDGLNFRIHVKPRRKKYFAFSLRREHEGSRKTIAQGMPIVSA
jgi:hypothetical protein